MLDIEEFCKLYKVNIPVKSEFDYYISTLKRSIEFGGLPNKLQEKIDNYINLEEFVKSNGYAKVRDYKDKCMNELKEFIVSSSSYKKMMESELPKEKLVSKDHTNLVGEYDYLVSLDFKSANFNILKTFDKANELGNSWEELCKKFYVHKGLVESKAFRQIVFGNTSPKRLQTFQHEKINVLVNYLKNVAGLDDDRFVFISHDEIVITVNKADAYVMFIQKHLEAMEKMVGMEIRTTPYSLRKIKKDTFVKTMLGVNPKSGVAATMNQGAYYFTENYHTLHGVPGNKFYMYFKKYILNSDCEERDLMYYNDGELCTWIDEDKKKKKSLPHYDKPRNELSMKEARDTYPYLWNELGSRMPDMANEEKRRVIELFVNTCSHCIENEKPCTCWREE